MEKESTTYTLKEFVDKTIGYIDRIICLKWESSEQALKLARQDLERRLEGMNEFRAQLEKQTQTFVTKSEYNIVRDRIEKDLKSIQLEMARKGAVNVALLLAVLSFLVSIIKFLWG